MDIASLNEKNIDILKKKKDLEIQITILNGKIEKYNTEYALLNKHKCSNNEKISLECHGYNYQDWMDIRNNMPKIINGIDILKNKITECECENEKNKVINDEYERQYKKI
jgi:hypothetical protein